MEITYYTTDLEKKTITLDDAVDIRINGVQINQIGDDQLWLKTDDKMIVEPMASNSIIIKNNQE